MQRSATQRGIISLFREPFEEKAPAASPEPSLRDLKVECILDAFYYYGRKKIIVNGKETTMSYASQLEVLSNNFFLSTFTLFDIINKNSYDLSLLKQEWKNEDFDKLKTHMMIKWPQFNWS